MIVVFGSINIDIVIQASGFPEKNGKAIQGSSYEVFHGGRGGNQAVAAKLAGAKKVYMVGAIGADDFGDRVMYNMRSKGVIPTGVGVLNDFNTGMACMVIDKDGNNSVVVTPGANLQASADQIPDSFFTVDTVVMQQMEVNETENWAVLKRAHDAGSTTILNVAPAADVPEGVLGLVDYLIVNEKEADHIKKHFGITATAPQDVAKELAIKFNCVCVVTLSEKGSYASDHGEVTYFAPTLKVDMVDNTAAGDAFCGTFAAAIDQGFALSYALHRASVAGALTCTKIGAQASLPDESLIDQYMEDCAEAHVI